MIGSRIGRYVVESRIGYGGHGTVWRAKEVATGDLVALKTLRSELADDEYYRARFTREADSQSKLDHPNIIKVLGSGEIDGVLYFAMEFANGGDLRRFLAGDYSLSLPGRIKLLEELASALDYAHEVGFIHRDVKPENVMVDVSNDHSVCPSLSDFGVVRIEDLDQTPITPTLHNPGTWIYQPKEIWELGDATRFTDIYALGCVAFEVFVGVQPFRGNPNLIHQGTRPRISDHVADFACFDHTFQKVFALDPGDRHASASEFVQALAEDICREREKRKDDAGSLEVGFPGSATRLDTPPDGDGTTVDDEDGRAGRLAGEKSIAHHDRYDHGSLKPDKQVKATMPPESYFQLLSTVNENPATGGLISHQATKWLLDLSTLVFNAGSGSYVGIEFVDPDVAGYVQCGVGEFSQFSYLGGDRPVFRVRVPGQPLHLDENIPSAVRIREELKAQGYSRPSTVEGMFDADWELGVIVDSVYFDFPFWCIATPLLGIWREYGPGRPIEVDDLRLFSGEEAPIQPQASQSRVLDSHGPAMPFYEDLPGTSVGAVANVFRYKERPIVVFDVLRGSFDPGMEVHLAVPRNETGADLTLPLREDDWQLILSATLGGFEMLEFEGGRADAGVTVGMELSGVPDDVDLPNTGVITDVAWGRLDDSPTTPQDVENKPKNLDSDERSIEVTSQKEDSITPQYRKHLDDWADFGIETDALQLVMNVVELIGQSTDHSFIYIRLTGIDLGDRVESPPEYVGLDSNGGEAEIRVTRGIAPGPEWDSFPNEIFARNERGLLEAVAYTAATLRAISLLNGRTAGVSRDDIELTAGGDQVWLRDGYDLAVAHGRDSWLRQNEAGFCASLVTLFPLQYLKGEVALFRVVRGNAQPGMEVNVLSRPGDGQGAVGPQSWSHLGRGKLTAFTIIKGEEAGPGDLVAMPLLDYEGTPFPESWRAPLPLGGTMASATGQGVAPPIGALVAS